MSKPVIHFINPITKATKQLQPLEQGHVRIYSCGPTVYNYAHIGNYRSFLFSDLLHRTLKHFGYKVTRVMNITDIDDKTITGAKELGVALKEFTRPYEEAFFNDLKSLRSLPATHYPHATDFIKEMLTMIDTLVKKNHAYEKDGSVYFRLASFPSYGKLSHIKQEMQKEGASGRMEDEYNKEDIGDFVLWKAVPENNTLAQYPSPYGLGRPGWHIECSAMSKHFLGSHFDIHTGGIDNRFPHHENEIAQSECCNEQTMADHWLHVSHLQVEGEKMSKSLGNFLTLRDIYKKNISAQTLRYMLLSTHYKNPYNFTTSGAEAAAKAISRLERCLEAVQSAKEKEKNATNKQQGNKEETSVLQPLRNNFNAALANDLNASAALGAVFDGVAIINKQLNQQEKLPRQNFLNDAEAFLSEANEIFAFFKKEKKIEIPAEVLVLQAKRDTARSEKNFKDSDELRKAIENLGFLVKDVPRGSEVIPK